MKVALYTREWPFAILRHHTTHFRARGMGRALPLRKGEFAIHLRPQYLLRITVKHFSLRNKSVRLFSISTAGLCHFILIRLRALSLGNFCWSHLVATAVSVRRKGIQPFCVTEGV